MRTFLLIFRFLVLAVYCQAQSGSTLERNGRAFVTEWRVIKDSISINGLKYKYVEAYNVDNVIIGHLYKTCEGKTYKYKIRIDLYDNPIKEVKVYNAKGILLEKFGNNDDE